VYSQYSASCTAVDIADDSGKAICLPDVVPTSLPTIFKGEVSCKVSLCMCNQSSRYAVFKLAGAVGSGRAIVLLFVYPSTEVKSGGRERSLRANAKTVLLSARLSLDFELAHPPTLRLTPLPLSTVRYLRVVRSSFIGHNSVVLPQSGRDRVISFVSYPVPTDQ